ncbi:hypothetical protein DEO72_LG4g268 [Vigna unguiculata]|uniref:Uncharacterized protein n=1 Tax=Vigna unguiculata TaxID=3917 RepID=A0A4D6LMR5_VIGUN|nr:hypothetical protein DEO72_LG4g268 [Vigna unguiculata]
MVLDSQLEQRDGLKEGEIGVASNDRVVAPRNEEAEEEFVAQVSTSEIPRIVTSLTKSQPVERPTPSYLNISLRETHSNALMNQQKPLGEIVSSPGIPQIIERVVAEETITKNTNMAISSIHSESTSSQLYQTVTFQSKSHTHSAIRSSQTEAVNAKESEEHPNKIIEDIGANDMMSLFAPVVVGKEGEDNLVAKTVAELEKYLKMPLKDIVSSETNTLSLLSALNFLSNLPFRNVTVSDGIKHIIHTMHRDFPTILFSFKQGFTTADKLAELEARANEVTIKRNLYEEAQRKEVDLKEQIIRLKEEIRVCERDGLKEGEIGVASNDRVVAPRNEEAEEEFVAQVSTSEIPRIVTSLTKSQPVERPTPSYLNISLRETHSNALMNQQKPLGEIVSSPGIPQIIERVVAEETITKNTNMAISSIHSESTSSQLYQTVTFQSKSHTHSAIRSSQTEAVNAKESEEHPNKIIEDIGANDMMSLFAPVVVGKEGEDNLVAKTVAELEKYLKMPLKDIVSSETNTLSLLSALNFLSNLPFRNVTVSDGIKHIIHTMHRDFPTILFSFKQGFTTADKLAELEARANEVTIKRNLYEEAQRKEVDLKEQIIRLKEEIRVCEVALSSLEEEKNKCIAETVGYKTELQNVRKYESQMLEVAYKWSVLCSQYQLNRMPATNPS